MYPNISADILPRSGLAKDHGITVLYSPGLIDPNYTGEILVILINLSKTDFHVTRFSRIAQLRFNEILPVDNMMGGFNTPKSNKPRGNRGFGSSGST